MRPPVKKIFFALSILCIALTFAAVGEQVKTAVSSLCSGIQGMLPVAAMLMITIGAVIYAAGQIMGAETRARANVWATASLTGALFGILIVAVSPPVLNALYPGIDCAGGSCGNHAPCANGESCCAGANACFNPQTHGCCGNNVYATANQICCTSTLCNRASEKCCGNRNACYSINQECPNV